VRINLKHSVWPSSLEAREPGNWDGVVAPENDRHRPGRENSRGCVAYPRAVAFAIRWIGIDVATIAHHLSDECRTDQNTIQIKIELLKLPSETP
jgi:hypothetical protein